MDNHFHCEFVTKDNVCSLHRGRCYRVYCIRNGVCSLCTNEEDDEEICNDCVFTKGANE